MAGKKNKKDQLNYNKLSVDLNKWLIRDWRNEELTLYDFCLYFVINEAVNEIIVLPNDGTIIKGRFVYIGNGTLTRPISHVKDELSNYLLEHASTKILSIIGMSKNEVKALEAFFIRWCDLPLTKFNHRYDNIGLINKRYELKNEELAKNITKLYGNNKRITV